MEPEGRRRGQRSPPDLGKLFAQRGERDAHGSVLLRHRRQLRADARGGVGRGAVAGAVAVASGGDGRGGGTKHAMQRVRRVALVATPATHGQMLVRRAQGSKVRHVRSVGRVRYVSHARHRSASYTAIRGCLRRCRLRRRRRCLPRCRLRRTSCRRRHGRRGLVGMVPACQRHEGRAYGPRVGRVGREAQRGEGARPCARALGAQPRRELDVPAHVRHVRGVVAAVVGRVVHRSACVAQPAAEGELPAPRGLVQRLVALALWRVHVAPRRAQPLRQRQQLGAAGARALARHRAEPVLRTACKAVELAGIDAGDLDEVARDISVVLPHGQLERRHALLVARVGVHARALHKVPHAVELPVAGGPVQRPPALGARRRFSHALGVLAC
mmetsp:Transcript_22910/g.74821  ORF Transcript_22910/g.74821 Transcript_22910/m.74821 type:complete len:385 (-) Transcript_22910:261-1415(-)